MRSLKICLLISCFFLDVRLRARAETTQVPKSCWGETVPCAVEANSDGEKIEAPRLVITMANDSLLEQQELDRIQLVKGKFYVSTTSKEVKFTFPYGRLQCDLECKALIERAPHQVQIKFLMGSWRLWRRGDAQPYGMPAGVQVLLREVKGDGQAELEFPQSLPLDSTLREWAQLYPGTPDEWKKEVRDFKVQWQAAVEGVSDLHRREGRRTLNEHHRRLAAIQARIRARQEEDARLRRMFREKNHIDGVVFEDETNGESSSQ